MNRYQLAQSTRNATNHRRHMLAQLIALSGVFVLNKNSIFGQEEAVITESEIKRVEDLMIRFKQADIADPKVSRSERFVVVSNARPEFVRQVLHIAEDTAMAYNSYMNRGRMPVKFQDNRMMIVVLANAGQYNKLMGEKKGRNEGGHFDLDENWTVTFDHRGRSRSTKSMLERANQVTLIHEVTHQISYNTGLLNINTDTPMLVSEGLATLAEPAGSAVTAGFGQLNQPRIAVMARIMRRNPKAFIPLRDLITSDDAFFADDDPTLQMAYGQAWLFWDTAMNHQQFSGKMPIYLKRIDGRLNPDTRFDDFVAAFGSISEMEQAMYQNLQNLIK